MEYIRLAMASRRRVFFPLKVVVVVVVIPPEDFAQNALSNHTH